jgi:hypothetical protein
MRPLRKNLQNLRYTTNFLYEVEKTPRQFNRTNFDNIFIFLFRKGQKISLRGAILTRELLRE